MAEAKIVSKISLKSIGATPAKNSVEAGKPVTLAAIYGTVHKHETVTTTFGDSERFVGNVEAINIATGDTYRSGKMFVPSIVEELLAAAVDSVEDGSVEFALEIGAEHSEKGNMGYAYTVKPLRKMAEADSLAHLRAEVADKLAALPAPEAKPETSKGAKKK